MFIVVFLLLTLPASAQSPQIISGLSWLTSAQTTTGYWTQVETTEYYSTVSALDALFVLDPTSSSYTVGLQWLSSQIVSPTDYLARQIIAQKNAGQDTSIDLASLLLYRNADGGWGEESDYSSNVLDTSLALQSLKAANYSDLSIINAGLAYLTGSQNVDGGWGSYSGDDSNVYMTALVSFSLQQFTQTTTLATAVNKATSYLKVHQNTDGGFGTPSTGSGQGSSSTVYETALAYEAVANVITDATVLGNAVNYLTTTQSSDGSWGQDPYSTALALKALYLSENKPAPPSVPTTGTVTGTVVDSSTNQSLSGVTVTLASDPSIATISGGNGSFSLTNVPQGSGQITFSLSGYATSTATVTMTAGSIINIGSISLMVNSASGIIQGSVTDASTGTPIAGVTISVIGTVTRAATTSTDGSYRITDIAPGSVSISAGKTGYYTVSGAGTVTAGNTLVFSPSLSTTPSTATTGDLKGTVLDSLTGLPIQGATTTITPLPSGIVPATSNASGVFALNSIAPGSYSVSITTPNYTGQTYIVTIIAGVVTDLGAIRLTPSSSTSTTLTVFGTVWDAETNGPLAGAGVSVWGTNKSALTDSSGKYTLSGITEMEMNLKASAVGYNSKLVPLTVGAFGEYEVSFALDKSSVSTVVIKSLSTDKPEYPANTPVNILSDIENIGDATAEITVRAQIADQYGNILGVVSYAGNPMIVDPHAAQTITLQWNPEQNIPGPYQITLSIFDHAQGGLLAESAAIITITSTVNVDGLVSLISPRFVNVKATETISISAYLVNRSNVGASFSAQYEIKDPAGVVIKDGTIDFPLSNSEAFKVISLTDFTNTFTKSGQYPVSVKILSGGEVLGQVADAIYVAPAIRLEPTKNLAPTTVVPDGDKEIRINIQIKGVEDLQ